MTKGSFRSTTLAMVCALAALVTFSGAGAAEAAPARTLAAFKEAPVLCDTSGARSAADAYLDALVSHDASAVPFAPDARRVENGLVTGRSGDEIREDLNTSVKYKIINGLRDRKYSESAPTADGVVSVNVDYLLDIGLFSAKLLTVRVKERFDVKCGQITYITATIGLS